MGGDTEAARMGNALTVAQEQIGRLLQFQHGLQHSRNFAEGEQAGDIGERGGSPSDGRLDQLQRFEIEDGDRGAGDGVVFLEADIHPRDGFDFAKIVMQYHAIQQRFLDLDRFLRTDIPRVHSCSVRL